MVMLIADDYLKYKLKSLFRLINIEPIYTV